MKSTLLIALFFIYSVNTQGQFFKKLKDKISQKVENVVDQKIDKVLTGTSEETGNTKSTVVNANGTCTIEHNNSIGSININEFGNVKTIASNHQLKINGSWFTHDVDIADGIFITIIDPNFTSENVAMLNSKSYTLYKSEDDITSKGAVMSIAYDPNKTNSTPSKDYQNYYLINGSLTIKNISDTSIEISFNGTPLDTYHTIQNLASNISGSLLVNNTTTTYDFEKNQQKEKEVTEYDTSSINLEDYGISQTKSVSKTYAFDHKITYDYDDGNNHQKFYLLQNQEQNYYATSILSDEGNAVFIQDGDVSVGLIEANGQKMQVPSQQSVNDKIEQSFGDLNSSSAIQKTGKTKNILGYKAYQYNFTNNEGSTEIWASEEVNLKNVMLNTPAIKGFILEITFKQKGDTFTSKITKIEKESTSFDTNEYKNLLNMGY